MADALSFTGEIRMLIDGELVEADSGKRFENVNPATEEVLGEVADASAAEMQRAIAAARRAFDDTDWATNRALRKRCLEQLQEALESEREELRHELVAEVGTPVMLTYAAQLDGPLEDGLRYPAKMIDEFAWERALPNGMAFGISSRRAVWKEPLGVVGAIVPWNYPFEVTINKIGQILATGNTTVLKPAPDTPWNATRLGRLVAEKTDIPPGVFNVVTSSDHLVGEELTLSPQVDMISFTGSTATGKRIMEKGAATLTRVFLELGGKSAMIVLDDADFATVVPSGMTVCMHGGPGVRDADPDAPAAIALRRGRRADHPGHERRALRRSHRPQRGHGPARRARSSATVCSATSTPASEEGAELVVGGGRPADRPRGYFVEPTLFVDVDNSMTIAQEEIFGPVLAVIPYDDDDDAVRIANDSGYGLSGGVFSASEERATAIARRVRTGSIGINGGLWYGADSPYGGYKASGIGRQNGLEGFEQYLETKAVAWSAT